MMEQPELIPNIDMQMMWNKHARPKPPLVQNDLFFRPWHSGVTRRKTVQCPKVGIQSVPRIIILEITLTVAIQN